MTTQQVDILLPGFTTESETQLNRILSSMGMPRAFSMSAEFPNMAQGYADDLFVSMMKQKAKIEVTEEGTKAAAATVIQVELKEEVVIGQGEVFRFHAKRPFVYYIVERSTGAILFMGTYCGEHGETPRPVEVIEIDEHESCGLSNKTNREQSSDQIYRSAERMPRFPGGDAAMMKYLKTHIIYPDDAARNHIQGKVIVQFVVERDGKIGEVKVVRSVDKDLDREAKRLVKTFPKFEPGQQNGKAVPVWYTLPVEFKLEEAKK